jgi:hypothetical protein
MADERDIAVLIDDLRQENRRLRQILDAVARARIGTGALVEVYQDRDEDTYRLGVVVCRADRDEVAFLGDVRASIERLARALGSEALPEPPRRTGVTAGDPNQSTEAPR